MKVALRPQGLAIPTKGDNSGKNDRAMISIYYNQHQIMITIFIKFLKNLYKKGEVTVTKFAYLHTRGP